MNLPEHEKLKAIKPLSQAVGNFIEWLGERGMAICAKDPNHYDEYKPVRQSIEKMLADHFGIDLNQIEAEKDAMLEEFQAATAET